MGLFDQDDIPIIQSILGNGNGWNQASGVTPGNFANVGAGSLPQNINPAVALGLNKYNAGDPYGALNVYGNGAELAPTGLEQFVPPGGSMPDADRAVAPVSAPQAAGQVPMPTSDFQRGPQPGATVVPAMQPGSPAPPLAAPINVGRPPGMAPPDPGMHANRLGKALGITSPQQGQNIASQFLSGLGAGMSAAGQYANKPGGAAFAGSFGAALQGAQARGQQQAQTAFELMKFQAAQQQQDRMNKLLERRQNYAEQHGNVSDLLNTYREIDNHHLSTARAGRYDAAAAWDNRRATQENSKAAWQLSPTGKAHQIETEYNTKLAQQRQALQFQYKDAPELFGPAWEKTLQALDAEKAQRYKDRGIDPSKVTKGTQASPHEPDAWVQTRAWEPGTVYKAPDDYKDANGTLHKKGTLTTRGADEYNTPLGPRPQTPQEYPQQQMPISEEQPAAAPSDQEILAAANG